MSIDLTPARVTEVTAEELALELESLDKMCCFPIVATLQ